MLGGKPAGQYTYCFADKQHGLYLYARRDDEHGSPNVNSIFLSSFPNCRHLPVTDTEISPETWHTPEGIGIGSTKAEVTKAYGKPTFTSPIDKAQGVYEIAGIRDSERAKADVGDWTFLYSCLIDEKNGCDDLRVTRFSFERGKLVWIAISDSE